MFSRHKQSSPLAAGPKWYAEEQTRTAEANANAHERERAEADALVEDYLDHVSAGLLSLPRARRTEIRREIEQHIAALARAHEELDDAPLKAAQKALARFGDPAKIARSFSRAWKQPISAQEATAFPGAALKQGLLWFGGAGMMTLASSTVLTTPLGTSNAGLWQCWNAAALVGIPLMAGWKVGGIAPARAAFGTFLALSLLLLVTASFCASAWTTLPYHIEPLEPVALLLAWWMPLGCASAALSARRARLRPAPFRLAR